ncbi:hypothetical protein NRB56_76520 [Nocardia sp. RB56]|uniref:Uncharacterized protein n=1 Tax=Nocardia aurantia TaxID=2585199 RepID=A0A7K0E1Z3_9NOCA|nr:hypothetical protein [Nocardia aurantia]
MRCCASDNGTSAGRCRATSALRAPSPACDSMRAASAATVLASNSMRTGTRVSSAVPSREATWVAISELPPSSKKSSSTPTRTIPSTSPKIWATISSIGVVGARNSRTSKTGAGSARRSSLPEALSGKASSTTIADGTM